MFNLQPILLILFVSFSSIKSQSYFQNSDIIETSYENCLNPEILCIESPLDCIENRNCSLLLTSKPINEQNKLVEFEIYRKIDKTADEYIAMSLSQSQQMGGSVSVCAVDNKSKTFIRNGVNDGYRPKSLPNVSGFTTVNTGMTNGFLWCKWKRDSLTYINNVEYDMEKNKYFIQIAIGNWNTTKDYIKKHVWKESTEQAFNLLNIGESKIVPFSKVPDIDSKPQPNKKTSNDINAIYDDCKQNKKLCFGTPDGCVDSNNCQILGTTSMKDSKTRFELLGAINAQNYIALGLSKNEQMGGSVVQCYLKSDGMTSFGYSFNSYTDIHSNSLVPTLTGIEIISNKLIDGSLLCVWDRDVITEVNGETFNLQNNSYHIQLATGPLNGETIRKHSVRASTKEALNLHTTGTTKASGVSPFIKWHGSLMIFSWVGCVTTGIVMARYYRDEWPKTTLFGVKIWFVIHRSIMALSWTSMIISVIVIWCYRKGWSGPYPHPVLGLISVVFATLQVINSFLRPHPGSANRWIFDWVHWFEGNLAHILAFCAILFVHLNWVNKYVPNSFFWVFMSFIFFFMLISDAMKKLKNKTEGPVEPKSSAQNTFILETDSSGDTLYSSRMSVLFLYSIVCFALTLTLIILICNF